MSNRSFLSTTEYSRKHNISKMQVTRLIKTGDLVRIDADKGEIEILRSKSHKQSFFILKKAF